MRPRSAPSARPRRASGGNGRWWWARPPVVAGALFTETARSYAAANTNAVAYQKLLSGKPDADLCSMDYWSAATTYTTTVTWSVSIGLPPNKQKPHLA